MSYDVTGKKLTLTDGEICFYWTYKDVRGIKRLPTTFAIDEWKLKSYTWKDSRAALEKMANGTAEYPLTIVDQHFGSITAYMKNDCLRFDIYDGDSYVDELDEDYFEDGIQQEIIFDLTKNKTKEFLKFIPTILPEDKK